MRSRRSIAALSKAKNISSMGRHPAENAREALAQAFLKRSVKMLERVSSSASSEALKSALSSPTDVGGVATLLSDLAPLDVDLSAVDPFVEAMARGAAIKQELLTSGGGGLTSSQVASALGITRQAVDKRRIRRALLAVPNGSGDYVYPACQFTSDGRDYRALRRSFGHFRFGAPGPNSRRCSHPRRRWRARPSSKR